MNPKVPISLQTALISALGLVLCGAVVVFGSAYTVGKLTRTLADAARDEGRQLALATCENIGHLIKEKGSADLREVAADPEVVRQMEILAGQGAVVLAVMADENGNVVGQAISEKSFKECLSKDILEAARKDSGPEPYDWNLIRSSIENTMQPLDFPIVQNERTVGRIRVALHRDSDFPRISMLSDEITRSLLMMVMLVFAILLLTIVLVYYAFQRQIELMKRTAESENMANIGTLASGLAHEIRNPLHAMNLHLEVAREDLEAGDAGPDETSTAIRRVQNQVGHLNTIVTNFLSATMPSRMELVDTRVDQLVDDISALLKQDMDSKSIRLEIDMPGAVTVKGNGTALRQVLINLINNAQHAVGIAEKKHIRVSAERTRRTWCIYVDDSGPGIPPDQETVIFRKFVSKRAGGTGFGLSIACRIMEGHRGSIRAGKSPLGGARFTLEFPFDGEATVVGGATEATVG